MMIDIEDPRRQKGLHHIAYAINARIENEQQVDWLFFTSFSNCRLFDDITGIEKGEIPRDIVIDDDAHLLSQIAQIVHDTQGRSDGVSIGIDMRRNDDVLRFLKQCAGFF